MLADFLTEHRDAIVARTRARIAAAIPAAPHPQLDAGIAQFVEQVARTLRYEQPSLARSTSADITRGAGRHGGELLRAGFPIAQVVHDYRAVAGAVAALAAEQAFPVTADELRTLNQCLDAALVTAVGEYASQRELAQSKRGAERMGFFAHEIGNLVTGATLAFEALQTARIGVGGSTGAVLERNLARLRHLAERSRAEVRLDAGLHHRELIPLNEVVEHAGVAAALEAGARGFQLTVVPVEPGVVIEVDRHLVAAALANLLQNAFKFSQPRGEIVLRTDTTRPDDRVLIEVEDECGGLGPEVVDGMFQPFQRWTGDRSGLGLGLAIARESIEANGGVIRARSVPELGCVFTVDLPRFLVGGREWGSADAHRG